MKTYDEAISESRPGESLLERFGRVDMEVAQGLVEPSTASPEAQAESRAIVAHIAAMAQIGKARLKKFV